MWPRAALAAGLSAILLVACGGDGGAPSTEASQPATATNATEPVSGTEATPDSSSDPSGRGPKPPAFMTASPSCAPVGSRVVLKLGRTSDQRSIDCYDADATHVEFAPGKDAKITAMGPMSDGYCAIDVQVPKGAESGKIKVSLGDDLFETESVFPVPCP